MARQPVEGGNPLDTVSKACAFGDFEKLKTFVDADQGEAPLTGLRLQGFLQYENAVS